MHVEQIAYILLKTIYPLRSSQGSLLNNVVLFILYIAVAPRDLNQYLGPIVLGAA